MFQPVGRGLARPSTVLPWNVSVHAHVFAGSGPHPDFGSPFPSSLLPSRLRRREPSTIEGLYRGSVPITAVFLATKPAA